MFNDIAVCIAAVLEHPAALSRILVIDLDVHQGNGTAAIFADEPRVTTFDMFGDKNYPCAFSRCEPCVVERHIDRRQHCRHCVAR